MCSGGTAPLQLQQKTFAERPNVTTTTKWVVRGSACCAFVQWIGVVALSRRSVSALLAFRQRCYQTVHWSRFLVRPRRLPPTFEDHRSLACRITFEKIVHDVKARCKGPVLTLEVALQQKNNLSGWRFVGHLVKDDHTCRNESLIDSGATSAAIEGTRADKDHVFRAGQDVSRRAWCGFRDSDNGEHSTQREFEPFLRFLIYLTEPGFASLSTGAACCIIEGGGATFISGGDAWHTGRRARWQRC